jgi:catechol 2,3-dioxygenase-like lactoylglutathione lyase family enzyme
MPTSDLHLALQVGSPDAVRAFHEAGVSAGGTSHGTPRRWPIIRRGEFTAMVADPDGNLIEAVSPE